MKKILTEEQLCKLINAHEQVLGTNNYTQYQMCLECKYLINGKWTPWKFVCWTIPLTGNVKDYYFKSVKNKLYLMHEGYDCHDEVERYEVTPAVRELWGM